MKRLAMVFLLSMLVVGCQDRPTATGPSGETTPPGDLNFLIVDGAHAGGNPDFFFLPPLQPSPLRNRNFDRGKFNPNLMPVVKICDGIALNVFECAVPLKKNGKPVVFNAVRGWDRLPDWIDPEQYHVLWQTRDYNLSTTKTYRILVKVGSTLLGYLDIKPTNQLLSALRITAGGQDVGWLDDWVVPIRFRIEQGALCAPGTLDCTGTTAVGATADTVVLPSKLAAVVIPVGAVGANDTVTIVIAQQAPPSGSGGKCLPGNLVQSQGCYHFSTVPANYPFHAPVRIEACVNVELVPAEKRDLLLLYKYNTADGLVALPRADTTEIDCSNFVLGAADLNAPTSLAGTVLRGAQRFLADLVSPPALHAATMATPPKGLGGLAGSFSDVGGAVPNVPPGVVSWWPAERDALDLYGRNNGVLIGGTTFAPGIVGNAFTYDGIDDFVVAPDITVLDTLQRLSVEAWVKFDALNAHDERIVTIAPERVVLRHDAGQPDQLHFYMNFGTRTSFSLEHIFAPNVLQTGCFAHVVGTYDGAQMLLYLNGSLIGSHLIAGTVAPGSHDQIEINSGSAPTKGQIDEARVYSRALTATEIAAIYEAGNASLKCAPRAPQAINFVQPASPAVYGSTFAVAPTASSGLTVTVEATGGCTIASGTATMTSGTTVCVLTATQQGNTTYSAATPVVRTVAASKAAQATVLLTVPGNGGVRQAGLSASASGGSGTRAYGYFSSTLLVCTVDPTTGSIVTLALGQCTLTATRDGDDNYLAATSAPQSFQVTLLPADVQSSLAFAASDGHIYRLDPGATTWTDLTPDAPAGSINWAPSWWPDGTKLAFTSNRSADGLNHIWTMNGDGTGVLQFTNADVADVWPAVSPNALSIAFTRNDAFGPYVHVEKFDHTWWSNLIVGTEPAWSPNNLRIAFTAYRGAQFPDVWSVLVTDTFNLQQISFSPVSDHSAAWAPTGDIIAFSCAGGGFEQTDICLSTAAGVSIRRIGMDGTWHDGPTWSPDGSWIAFTRRDLADTYSDIYVVRPDGTGLRRVTDGSMRFSEPAWPQPYHL